MNTGDPHKLLRERIRNLKPSLPWDGGDPTWPTRARAALISAVGLVDQSWPDAYMTLGKEIQEKDYKRVRVEFPSHEGWNGRGWLLIPDEAAATAPAVVCLPGHGKGADAIVGLIEEPYQANFAVQCVHQGWVTLAVEQVSFGTNRSQAERERESSCAIDSMAALLLGETITGWRVRDAMAARRALSTLPMVDPTRIGVLGISGGGLTSLWAAAIDEGFRVVGVSGYFCPMSQSILNVDHCSDNYVPGFALLMDVPDLVGLIAPRWLAVESGTNDPLFTANGFNSACDLARKIYLNAEAPERFVEDLFEGDHVFNGNVVLRHMKAAFS